MTKLLTTHRFSVSPTVLDSLKCGLIWATTDYIYPNARPTLKRTFRQRKIYLSKFMFIPQYNVKKKIHFDINFIHGPEQRIQYSNWLRSGWSGDRIPMWARFPAPILAAPGVQTASYTEGIKSILLLNDWVIKTTDFHLGPRLKKQYSSTSTITPCRHVNFMMNFVSYKFHTPNTHIMSHSVHLYQPASLSPSSQSVPSSPPHSPLTFHNIPPSVPSTIFDIQHFLKPFTVTSVQMCCHAVMIH